MKYILFRGMPSRSELEREYVNKKMDAYWKENHASPSHEEFMSWVYDAQRLNPAESIDCFNGMHHECGRGGCICSCHK